MAVLPPFRLRPAAPLDLAVRLTRPGPSLLAALALGTVLVGEAWAQDEARPSPVALIAQWAPLIAKGLAFNILISVLSMAIGTVLGVALGIAQTARAALVRRPAWVVTQFFRDSPGLVPLFYGILPIPFEVDVLGRTILFPAWIKAVIGLSPPTA